MTDSNRLPVIVGVGFADQRCDDPREAREPFDLMLDAVKAAGEDAVSPSLLSQADAIYVVQGAWDYQDPGSALAAALQAPQAISILTEMSGSIINVAIHDACRAIASGEQDIAVITGAECGHTRGRLRKLGAPREWKTLPGKPDRTLGEKLELAHPAEAAVGLLEAREMYPIFENALRHRDGLTINAHLDRLGRLAEAFSRVAVDNPHAAIRELKTASEIATPGPGNRAISFPYTLLLNSNSRVDQGGALILCSQATARRLGVPADRWVYPLAGTEAYDTVFLSERDSLSESAGIRFAGEKLYELAGVGPDELDHVDLYSCFQSAVQVAARELGLPEDQPRTVTGGMTFAGGPLNCYVIRSTATMVERLRAQRGDRGLVTGNGGLLSKHALTLYSTEPPPNGFQFANVQKRVDQVPHRKVSPEWTGESEIESYTVMYEQGEPDRAYVACRLPDQSRGWALSRDRDLLIAMTREEFCGRRASRAATADLKVF